MAQSNYTALTPAGYFPISATSGTVVTLSTYVAAASAASANITLPNFALVSPETQAIRWRDDGTDPAAAVSGGQPLAAGSVLQYDGPLNKFRFVSQTGTATVNISLYRGS